ncbi:MAG: SRPBCC family protein [Clostridiales bacterium]|nr:SRPBCC family protein [Clostridiales bacterium]
MRRTRNLRGKAGGAFGLFFLSSLVAFSQEIPDFGPDGMAGLGFDQRQKLVRGEIIHPKSLAQTTDGKTMIEAALLFEKPPEEVWQLLVRTENQVKFLDQVKKVTIIRKEASGDTLEFTTKILTETLVFRVNHEFDEKNLFIRWALDKSFKNDLRELEGFWRFYPLCQSKTIARYGSRVKPNFPVPGFIYDVLARNDLRTALASVKKYVDSGGVWSKDSS